MLRFRICDQKKIIVIIIIFAQNFQKFKIFRFFRRKECGRNGLL